MELLLHYDFDRVVGTVLVPSELIDYVVESLVEV